MGLERGGEATWERFMQICMPLRLCLCLCLKVTWFPLNFDTPSPPIFFIQSLSFVTI